MGGSTQVNKYPMYTEEQRRVAELFYPYMLQRLETLGPEGRLVHYCSATTAMSIIANGEVWLRNTSVMNDFMEVEHGLQALSEAYKSAPGQRFKATLDNNLDGVCTEVADLFDKYQAQLRLHSYVTCVSEHSADEDFIGRLSMWRAYGRTSGVAMVLKIAPFRATTDVLRAYSSPVRYVSRNGLFADFETLAKQFEANVDYLRSLGRDVVRDNLFNMFKWAALSIKHPGFAEEREWRVVYVPSLGLSDVILPEIQAINGVPQTIYKLPLRTFREDPDFSTAIPDILDRLIIGPTEFLNAMQSAFVELLRRAGVPDPSTRVVVSDIPLR